MFGTKRDMSDLQRRLESEEPERRPSMVEVMHNTDRSLREQPVQLKPAPQQTQRQLHVMSESRNPLPQPDDSKSQVWKAAFFIRALRTEDMQDMAKDMHRLLPESGIKTADDVQNWLLRWARLEHGIVDVSNAS